MNQETKAVIENYYAAFNAGDEDRFLDLLTESVIHDINQGKQEIGKENFRCFMQQMARSYKENITEITIMCNEGGNRAAAEFVVLGEYLIGDENLPKAHGQRYRLPAGAFFSLCGNKITRVTNYYNLTNWVAQVSC